MRIALLGILVAVAPAAPAHAHATLTFPSPRTLSNKAGPCGSSGSARGTNITSFDPGSTITVEWDETVDHPGHFRIAFDTDGNDFQNPVDPNDAFPETMVEPIADKAGGHYTQELTLPNVECDNCTLQLIQVMTTSIPYNSFYFQCADITLLAGAGSGGMHTGDGPEGGGCSARGGAGSGSVLLVGLIA